MPSFELSRRTALATMGATLVAPGRLLAQGAPGKVLKLGSLCTQTGPSASIGKESITGLQYGVKRRNDAGGVQIGPDTYRIELINVDDESKTERGVAGAERLISEDRVSCCSRRRIAAAPSPSCRSPRGTRCPPSPLFPPRSQ